MFHEVVLKEWVFSAEYAWTRSARYDASAYRIGVRAARASTRSLSRAPPRARSHPASTPTFVLALLATSLLFLATFAEGDDRFISIFKWSLKF